MTVLIEVITWSSLIVFVPNIQVNSKISRLYDDTCVIGLPRTVYLVVYSKEKFKRSIFMTNVVTFIFKFINRIFGTNPCKVQIGEAYVLDQCYYLK